MRIADVRAVLLTGPATSDPWLSVFKQSRTVALVEVATDAGVVGLGDTYAGYLLSRGRPVGVTTTRSRVPRQGDEHLLVVQATNHAAYAFTWDDRQTPVGYPHCGGHFATKSRSTLRRGNEMSFPSGSISQPRMRAVSLPSVATLWTGPRWGERGPRHQGGAWSRISVAFPHAARPARSATGHHDNTLLLVPGRR